LCSIAFTNSDHNMMTKSNTEAPNGIQWKLGQRLNDLDYADDIVLMAHTFSDIQQKLERLNDNARKIGLNINYRKTTYHALRNVWNQSCLSRNHQIRIYNTSVKSVLLYRSGTWRVTNLSLRQLQVFINKCLRQICKHF
jgi:hypothetical protein